MSVRYLLPCQCGESTPILPSQAGGTTTCGSCGAALEVPRLRDLRELPTESSDPAPSSGGWSFRLGVLTAGLFVATGLGATAAWLAATEPTPPPQFDAERHSQNVSRNLDAMSPVELWELYPNYFAPMVKYGVQQPEQPRQAAQEEAVRISQLYQTVLRYAALGVVGLSILAFAVLPR